MRLIDADALYERATTLEAQALDYVGKLIERDGDEPSVEWKIWSAILAERTAFKHDLMDAPTVDAEPIVRCKDCRYFDENDCLEQFCWCNFSEDRRTPDDFCSYGESGARMDGEA